MTENEFMAIAKFVHDEGAPSALSALVQGAWCVDFRTFEHIQQRYDMHRMGPKIDVAKVVAGAEFQGTAARAGSEIRHGVAIIAIDGLLAPKANLFTKMCGGTSLQIVSSHITAAINDDRVKAIVLSIDSPGGSVFGTPETADLIYSGAKKKPIVAHSDEQMRSAAYWIGCAANAVYLSGPTVQAGAIGVVIRKPVDPTLGDRSVEIYAGRYTRFERGLAAPNADAIAYTQKRADYLYSVFVEAVAKARGVSVAHVNQHMADGRTFIGSQAMDAGLVDGFMTLDDLVSDLSENPHLYAQRRRMRAWRLAGSAPRSHAASAAQAPQRPRNKLELTRAAHDYAATHQTDFLSALKALGF